MNNSNLGLILGTLNISYPFSSLNANTEVNKLDEYTKIIDLYIENIKGKTNTNTNINSDCKPILDTAYYYGNTHCEQILGIILDKDGINNNNNKDCLISTKANPWFENNFTNGILGGLSAFNLERQLNESLQNLKKDKVDIFYLHCPDHQTPIFETLEKATELWRKDKYDKLGVSNFSLGELIEVLDVCESNGFIAPDYYQGMYNILCRKVEEIFPLLDDFNIEFWAYNPLAGGLLSGKYHNCIYNKNINNKSYNNDITLISRFKDNQIYKNIFWKDELLNAAEKLFNSCEKASPVKKSFDWLQYYSKLRANDKIIIGASTSKQLIENMECLQSESILTLDTCNYMDSIYAEYKDMSPDYFY